MPQFISDCNAAIENEDAPNLHSQYKMGKETKGVGYEL